MRQVAKERRILIIHIYVKRAGIKCSIPCKIWCLLLRIECLGTSIATTVNVASWNRKVYIGDLVRKYHMNEESKIDSCWIAKGAALLDSLLVDAPWGGRLSTSNRVVYLFVSSVRDPIIIVYHCHFCIHSCMPRRLLPPSFTWK